MVNELVVEDIPCDVWETHIDAELITQEIKEWQDAMGIKIGASIGDEM